MCNVKKRIGIFMGATDVINFKNYKIYLALTQHKRHNILILAMAYQLPFKMCNVKKRIFTFRGGIDVIKVKNIKINLVSHSIGGITFLFSEWHINCHSKCAMSKTEFAFTYARY